MSPAPEPRIGDAEREAAVRALGEHYAAGRITKDEFDERSDLAMRARTDSELRPLFADLPRLYAGAASAGQGAAHPGPGRSHQAPSGQPRPPLWQTLPFVPLVVGLVFLAVFTKQFWLLFFVGALFFCRPKRPWGR